MWLWVPVCVRQSRFIYITSAKRGAGRTDCLHLSAVHVCGLQFCLQLCLLLNALEFSGEILYSTGKQCLSPSGGLRDKPALTWPTSLLIQLWQPASSWPGSRFSPLESGLRESQRPAVWSGTDATVNPSTLRPARLSTLSISYSSQERMSPPLPQNKQTEISENTITKKILKETCHSLSIKMSREAILNVSRLRTADKKNRTKGKGGVEENTEKQRVRQMEECFGFNNIWAPFLSLSIGDWSHRAAPQRTGRLGLSSPHQRTNLPPVHVSI